MNCIKAQNSTRKKNAVQRDKVERISGRVSEDLEWIPSSATNWLPDSGESSHCSEPQFSHLENVGAGSGEYNSMATNVRYCRILCAKRVTKQIIKYSRIIENSISLKPLLPMGSEVDRRAQTLGILCIRLITIYPQNIPSLTFKKGQNSQELNRNVNVL